VLALPDPRKGEQLLLVTTRAGAEVAPLLAAARARGIGEIMVPRRIMTIAQMPRLGSGKLDYPAVQRLAAAAPAPTQCSGTGRKA
jgi:acyl-[acyl-carrier-protein]-phospholipid O-acyltransferase/long-chain-fatty-acid--[acyl-carrier-protein] ligase